VCSATPVGQFLRAIGAGSSLCRKSSRVFVDSPSHPVDMTNPHDLAIKNRAYGCSGPVVEYRTRYREVAGSTRSRFTASNLEQVANLLCANSAFYPQRDGK